MIRGESDARPLPAAIHDRRPARTASRYAYQGETKVWEPITRDADAVLARYLGETPDIDEPWP